MRARHLLPLLLAIPAFAQTWQPEEFPIGFWCGPPAAYNTLESWRTVKDANFTWGMGGGYGVEGNRQMLDFCQQVGIRGLVFDSRVNWQIAYADNWQEKVGQVVKDYGAHPAFYGYFLQDEPNYMLFKPLGRLSQELQKQDPRHLPYINLFPTYATPEQLGTPNYADHLDQYLAIVKPAVLSYDHYCLRGDGTDGPDYFENLELARERSLRAGVPAWNIIQAMSYASGVRQPNDAEMRWQVYTTLAYGFKGVMYFVYWSYNDKPAEVGIVDHLGKPAKLYPVVKQLNGEMKTLGKALLGLTSTGVYHTGPVPLGTKRLATDELIRLPDDQPLLIGFLKARQGDAQYAMIVNRSHTAAVDFKAVLRPSVVGLMEVSARDASERALPVENGAVALHLEPGDGKLLRLAIDFRYPSPPEPLTKLDFQFKQDGDLEGWSDFNSLGDATTKDGQLTLTFNGADPYLCRPWLELKPDQYTRLRVRMKLPPCSPTAQFFWTNSDDPMFSDTKYVQFPVQPDGEWHEYEIPVAEHPQWKGKAVRAIRLDPTVGGAEVGNKLAIDWIVGE